MKTYSNVHDLNLNPTYSGTLALLHTEICTINCKMKEFRSAKLDLCYKTEMRQQ